MSDAYPTPEQVAETCIGGTAEAPSAPLDAILTPVVCDLGSFA